MPLITHSTLVNYVYQDKTLLCHDISFRGNGVIKGNSSLFDEITDILNINATSGNLEFSSEGKALKVYGQISTAKDLFIHSKKPGELTVYGDISAAGKASINNITQTPGERFISACKQLKIENSRVGSLISDHDIELNDTFQNGPGDYITGLGNLTAKFSYLGKEVKADGDIALHTVRQSILGKVLSENGKIDLTDNSSIGHAEAFNSITISKDSTVSSAESMSGNVSVTEPGLWRSVLAYFGW